MDLFNQENRIRDLINQEANPTAVLRLICLYSLVSGGFKPKIYEEIQREFLQTYGFEYLPTFVHLTDLNLFYRTTGTKSPFAQCRRPLKLVVDDVDESAPEDISYVYSGYAPVSVRLVQHALGLGASSGGLTGGIGGAGARERNGAVLNGWKGLDDIMQTLPGCVFEEVQKPDENSRRRRKLYLPDLVNSLLADGCIAAQMLTRKTSSRSLSFASWAGVRIPRLQHCALQASA